MNFDKKHCACLVAFVVALSCTFFVPEMSVKADELSAEVASSFSESEARYTGPIESDRYNDNAVTLASDLSNEQVYYTNREYTYYTTTNGVPLYEPSGALTNSCGATGGAIVVGFYDKYYENLIPNYTSYYTATGKYKSSSSNTYVSTLMSDLYTLMRTNVDDVGVSESDCRNGLKTYVQNKGYSLSYTSIKSGSSLNMTACQNAFRNNQPILLFCDQVGVVFVDEYSGYDNITTLAVANQHIMVAYGYYQVRYYNGSTNFRTDTYFDVATGLDINTTGWVTVDSISWLNNGYIVSIS